MNGPVDPSTDPSPRDRIGPAHGSHTYARESPEFGRIVNLCDAVFAIALTLLVLTLDGLEVAGLLSFGLAFLLVGNIWWWHLRIVAQLARFEPGMLFLVLCMLAGVALAPFPTSLVGNDPHERASVLPFIGLFALLSTLSIGFILRAHRVGAWRRPLPDTLFRWILLDWGTNLGFLLACLVVAIWWPVPALVLLVALSVAGNVVLPRIGPRERQEWF